MNCTVTLMDLNLPSGKLSIKTYSSQFFGFTVWDLVYWYTYFIYFLGGCPIGSRDSGIWKILTKLKKPQLNLQKHLNTDLNKKFSDNVIYTKTRVWISKSKNSYVKNSSQEIIERLYFTSIIL